MRRVKTGINGFDKLIEGGFPEGFSILVCGAPGTGKTIFSLEYLYRGAKEFNENGLYISIEETVENLKFQGQRFGWDFDKLEKQGKISFLKVPIDVPRYDITHAIEEACKKIKAKRIVLDSLSILSVNAKMYNISIINEPDVNNFWGLQSAPVATAEDIMQFIYIFVNRVEDLGATTLFVGDSPESGNFLTRDTVSEFVCDGLIKLEVKQFGKTVSRTLEIKKLRSTNASPGLHTILFEKNGLKITEFTY